MGSTDITDRLCAQIDQTLKGTTLTFSLILWVKGSPDNPQSVMVNTPPTTSKDETVRALRTCAAALEANPDERPTPPATDQSGEG